MVWREDVAVHVSSSWNGALQRIECFLGLLRTEDREPVPSILRVWRANRQRKAVDDEDERSVSPRVAHPSDVVLGVLGYNLSVCPVAHAVESSFAFDYQGEGLIP